MVKISVIIPVYNSEKYLNQCVDSVLYQTFTDFELILVDDGSKDNSLKLCKEYEQNDSRVKVITKENGGASSARNLGIKAATGDLITFIDSDDKVKPDFFARINEIGNNADMTIFGICFMLKGKSLETFPSPTGYKLFTKKEFFESKELYGYQSTLTGPVARSFKRSVIEKNHLLFDETMTVGEDSLFDAQFAGCSESIAMDCNCYYLCDKTNENSITHRYVPNRLECELKYITEADKVFSREMSKANYERFVYEGLYNSLSAITYTFQTTKRKSRRWEAIKKVASFEFVKTKSSTQLSARQRTLIWLIRYRLTAVVYLIYSMRIDLNSIRCKY